jgi:hypothetical protein
MIEPNDYEMCKHIADMVLAGLSEAEIAKFGYLQTEESRLCYAAALERPEYWSSIPLDTEAAGCAVLSDEFWESNKHKWGLSDKQSP